VLHSLESHALDGKEARTQANLHSTRKRYESARP
jgi:hypothetical protein